jgi:hypothetical protein
MKIFTTLFCLIAFCSTSIGQKDFLDLYIGMPESGAVTALQKLKSDDDFHGDEVATTPFRVGSNFHSAMIESEGCKFRTVVGIESGTVVFISMCPIRNDIARAPSCSGDFLATKWLNELNALHGDPKVVFHGSHTVLKWDSEEYTAVLTRQSYGVSIVFVSPMSDAELKKHLGPTEAERIRYNEKIDRQMKSVAVGMKPTQVEEICGEAMMTMEIMDEIVWTYGEWMVTFEDGKVTTTEKAW